MAPFRTELNVTLTALPGSREIGAPETFGFAGNRMLDAFDLPALMAALNNAETTLRAIAPELEAGTVECMRARIARARAELDLLSHWHMPHIDGLAAPLWTNLIHRPKSDEAFPSQTPCGRSPPPENGSR